MSFYFILGESCDCASSGPLQHFQQHEPFVLKTRRGKTWNTSMQHESWEETQAGWAAQENNRVFDGFWKAQVWWHEFLVGFMHL